MPVPMIILDPETQKKESERQFWMDALGAAGGALGGAAIGSLLINPLRYRQMRQAIAAMQRQRDIFQSNERVLRTLARLHYGAQSWDDIADEARPALEHAYQHYQYLLNSPVQLAWELHKQMPEELKHVPEVPPFQLSQVLPSQDMVRHPLQTLSHPASVMGGLIGSGLAGYAVNEHNHRRLYNQLKEQEGTGDGLLTR